MCVLEKEWRRHSNGIYVCLCLTNALLSIFSAFLYILYMTFFVNLGIVFLPSFRLLYLIFLLIVLCVFACDIHRMSQYPWKERRPTTRARVQTKCVQFDDDYPMAKNNIAGMSVT